MTDTDRELTDDPVLPCLSPAELERLAILAEEASEVVQAVGKILRHGYMNYHPDDPLRLSNRHNLERELGDFANIVAMMVLCGDVRAKEIEHHREAKSGKISRYLHHQEPPHD